MREIQEIRSGDHFNSFKIPPPLRPIHLNPLRKQESLFQVTRHFAKFSACGGPGNIDFPKTIDWLTTFWLTSFSCTRYN